MDLLTNVPNPLGRESLKQRCLEKIKHTARTPLQCQVPEISYVGHILRGSKYRLVQLILKGKIEGRR